MKMHEYRSYAAKYIYIFNIACFVVVQCLSAFSVIAGVSAFSLLSSGTQSVSNSYTSVGLSALMIIRFILGAFIHLFFFMCIQGFSLIVENNYRQLKPLRSYQEFSTPEVQYETSQNGYESGANQITK